MELMLWLLALSGYAITVQCSLSTIVANPGGIGGIYKGPNSETVIKGPDGSLITSQETPGYIKTESKLEPIIVAESEIAVPDTSGIASVSLAPVLSPDVSAATLVPPLVPVISATVSPITASVAPAAPILTPVNPVPQPHVVEIIEQDPHIIETEIVDAPAIEPKLSSDLVGPSGSISTRGSSSIISGPASTTISEPAKIVIAAPVLSAVPLISSIKTRLHATPFVEVNDEVPLKSISKATIAADVSLVLSTVAPIAIGAVSTLAPPVDSGINLTPTPAPPIIRVTPPGGNGNIASNVGSTLAPPLYDLGNIRGYVGSSSASPIPRGYSPVISSTIAPALAGYPASNEQVQLQVSTPLPISRVSTAYNQVLLSSVPPTALDAGTIVQPASSNGYVVNSPVSGQVSSTFRPNVLYSSTVQPPIAPDRYVPRPVDLPLPEGNIQRLDDGSVNNAQLADSNDGNDIAQPNPSYRFVTNYGQAFSTPLPYDVSTSGDIQRLDETSANTGQFHDGNEGNIVQPGSSYGFINNSPSSGQLASTVGSGVVFSSSVPTEPPGYEVPLPDGNIQRFDEALTNNRQFTIDPSNIPSRNIIPPEIGRLPPLPEGAVDLGTTYQVSTVPRAPGLIPTNSPANGQRIENPGNGYNDNGYINVADGLQNANVRNENLRSDSGRGLGNEVYQQSGDYASSGPLLRNTNPIGNIRDLQGPVEQQWSTFSTDSSQFQQADVPLGRDLPPVRPGDYDDRRSVVLWNRYGRRTRHGKQ